jgi:hypothetical protein
MLLSRADPKACHAAAVDIDRAVREEVQEQPIIRLLWICNMATPVMVVDHIVERWWVQDAEGRVGVLAV